MIVPPPSYPERLARTELELPFGRAFLSLSFSPLSILHSAKLPFAHDRRYKVEYNYDEDAES